MGMPPIVIDTGAERRELGMKMATEHFVDFKEAQDPVEKVVALDEGGGHVCLVTGNESWDPSSVQMLKNPSCSILFNRTQLPWCSCWRHSHVVAAEDILTRWSFVLTR